MGASSLPHATGGEGKNRRQPTLSSQSSAQSWLFARPLMAGEGTECRAMQMQMPCPIGARDTLVSPV